MAIIDTNILIDALSGNRKAMYEIESHKQKGLAAITIFNKYELSKGIDRLPAETISELVGMFKIYNFAEKEADESTKIYTDLKAKGQMIDELDILIAGTAIANRELLITNDKHFSRVKGIAVKSI